MSPCTTMVLSSCPRGRSSLLPFSLLAGSLALACSPASGDGAALPPGAAAAGVAPAPGPLTPPAAGPGAAHDLRGGPGAPGGQAPYTGVRLEDETGPIPPPDAAASELTLQLDPAGQSVLSSYKRTPLYREGLSLQELQEAGARPEDSLHVLLSLDATWAAELAGLLRGLQLCPATVPTGAAPTGGGSRRLIFLAADGTTTPASLGDGPAPPGSLAVCPPQRAAWERLLAEATLAARQQGGVSGMGPVRLLRITADGRRTELTLVPDHRTRTLTLTLAPAAGGGRTAPRQLDAAALRELRALLAGPNYYQEGDPTKLPDAPGEYLDRGEGRWFSLATGLKDPLGRTGAVTALQAGLARWWAQAAAR